METKQKLAIALSAFVLIAVGTMLYYQDGTITGAAAAILGNRETRSQTGLYKLIPSFEIEKTYTMEEYSLIQAKVKRLLETCKNERSNAKECIDSNKRTIFNEYDAFGEKTLSYVEACESESYEKFLKIVDYVDTCLNSQLMASCICRSLPEERPPEIYSIEIRERELLVNSTIGNQQYSLPIPLRLPLRAANELVSIQKDEFLHKDSEGKLLKAKDLGSSEECKPRPQEIFRLCVESNTKVLATDGDTKIRQLKYKFAIEIRQNLPINTQDLHKRYHIYIDTDSDARIFAGSLRNKLEDQIKNSRLLSPDESRASISFSDKDYSRNAFSADNLSILVLISAGEADLRHSIHPTVSVGDKELNTLLAESLQSKLVTAFPAIKLSPIEDIPLSFRPSVQIVLPKGSMNDASIEAIQNAILNFIVQRENRYDAIRDVFGYPGQTITIPFGYQDVLSITQSFGQMKDPSLLNTIARLENINPSLLAAIIKQESLSEGLGSPDDKKKHGLGGMYATDIEPIYDQLAIRPEGLLSYPLFDVQGQTRRKDIERTYKQLFTSAEPENIAAQIRATALRLKHIKETLEKRGIRNIDTRIIMQSYHDTLGKIRADGSSERLLGKEQDSIGYYLSVEQHYKSLLPPSP